MKDRALTKIFRVLSNPVRFKIYALILSGACELDIHSEVATNCAKKIARKLKLNQPTVSNHIKELMNANLVIVRKSGRHSYLFGVRKTSSLLYRFSSEVKKEVYLSSKSA